MPSVRSRADMAGKYELDYTDVDGRRYRIDTGTRDSKIAKMWLQEVERRLSMAKLGVIPKVGRLTREMVAGEDTPESSRRLRLDEWEEVYADRCEHDLELAIGTLAIIHNAFASFRSVAGNPYIDKLTEEDVRRWKRVLTGEKRSKNTVAMYQRALKTAFKRAVRWKFITESPFADVETPTFRADEKPRKSMDIKEVRKLLSVIRDTRFKRYIQFILYTACRRNEALYIQREDMDLEQRILYVHSQKTHRRLALPINKALWKVIQEMLESGELPKSGYIFRTQTSRQKGKEIPWHPHSVTHRFKDYIRLAGLPELYSLHSCRHTYATYLRSKGVPQDVIQRLLGHASPRTTDIYDHSDALFFRQFADMVDYDEEDTEESTET